MKTILSKFLPTAFRSEISGYIMPLKISECRKQRQPHFFIIDDTPVITGCILQQPQLYIASHVHGRSDFCITGLVQSINVSKSTPARSSMLEISLEPWPFRRSFLPQICVNVQNDWLNFWRAKNPKRTWQWTFKSSTFWHLLTWHGCLSVPKGP